MFTVLAWDFVDDVDSVLWFAMVFVFVENGFEFASKNPPKSRNIRQTTYDMKSLHI